MNIHEIFAISATIASLCLGNVCVKASKRGGKITYSMGTTLLMVQVVSFSICLIAMVAAKLMHKPVISWRFSRTTACYAVPVAFAIADYHLTLYISKQMNAALLSIVWNSEIAVTALLFRCILQRFVTKIGHISIILLVLGSVTSQSNYKLRTDTNNKEWTAVFLIIGIFVSAFANIFVEWAYKQEIAVPFLIQTLQFTFLSVCCHGVNAFFELENGLFHGFNGWTWGAVAMHSIANIGINYLMKYLDNIVCLYVHTVATMLTVMVSVPMFHADITLQFLCGSGITIISIYLHICANPIERYLIPSFENRVESDEAVNLNVLSPIEGLDCIPGRIHKRERLVDFLRETSGRFSRKGGTYKIITKTAYKESEQA